MHGHGTGTGRGGGEVGESGVHGFMGWDAIVGLEWGRRSSDVCLRH